MQSVWTLEADAREIAGHLEPVLPDGCPELVMQFGDPFEQLNADGTSTVQAAILFAGATDPAADVAAHRTRRGARHPLPS